MSSPIQNLDHLKIPLEDILEATNHFSNENFIRQGGFGKIYKGTLLRSGEMIDIVARRLDTSYGQGSKEFWTEVSMLSSLKHENLVSIVGFCDEKNEKIVINKYEAKGSLDNYLSDLSLTWLQRLQICVGVARALSYIHYDVGRDFSVIHRNIKSSKILLDDKWEPKLSGFELSVTNIASRRHHLCFTDACGTIGYVDPTYVKTGGVTHKSDMYSFGIVLFEVLFGRKAIINKRDIKLAELAKTHYECRKLADMVDPHLRKQMDKEAFGIFADTAYICLKEQRAERLNIDQIVVRLEKVFELQSKHETPVCSIAANASDRWKETNLEYLKIDLPDIRIATNNFHKEYIIASDGYRTVYRAVLDVSDIKNISEIEGKNKSELPKRSATVVIKRYPATHEEELFIAEIETIASCKHRNVVSLLGFCDEHHEMITVYEYASKGTLGDYLGGHMCTRYIAKFSWVQRMKICIEIAHGLNYIHTSLGDKQKIIHRDIKSRNILLNENLEAMIDGSPLCIFQQEIFLNGQTVGTPGYLDPEYMETGRLSKEVDIYSFGVVLFEICFWRSANDPVNDMGLAHMVRKCFKERTLHEMVDPYLKEEANGKNSIKALNPDSLKTFFQIAYRCLQETRDKRPTMEVVITELEKALHFQENKDNLKISLDEIKLATRNFSNLIGKGGFGQVYKGEVTHAIGRNIIVAKRLDGKSGEGETQLMTELEILLEYKHENLIGLVGYCDEEGEKIIVYEYASRGSLDRWLKHNDLTWRRRLAICTDIARGLDFLHGTSHLKEEVVIHRDIKAANILLHGDWKAKIADFGLSLISPINQEMDYVIDNAKGTSGYCDPQYITTSMLTKESDIYSFGVLLFEILCGRFVMEYDNSNARNLVHEVRRYYVEGRLDEMVFEAIKKQIVHESLTTYIDIAYECTHEEIESRPTARKVLIQLMKALEFQNHGAASTIPIQSYHDQTLKKFRIPLEEIRLAIGVKSTETQIGDGGFGLVYKGKLSELWQNRTAAIKYHDPKGYQGKDEFRNELKMISMFHHENIIPFIGYCDEGNEMIIVSEYATNGSLDQYLRNLEKRRSLTWVQRLKICLGAAKGINYLHSGLGDYNRVVHRDVKSANILLADNLKAKICDFGLSRSGPRNQPQTQLYTKAAGTKFYIDPIYHESGILRKESDVYSFGVVLFEVLSGMLAYDRRRIGDDKPQHLINLVRRYYEEGLDKLIDHLIKDQIDRRSFDTFVEIAHECISYNLNKRPTMQTLVERIEDALAYQVAKDSEMKEPEGKITEN